MSEFHPIVKIVSLVGAREPAFESGRETVVRDQLSIKALEIASNLAIEKRGKITPDGTLAVCATCFRDPREPNPQLGNTLLQVSVGGSERRWAIFTVSKAEGHVVKIEQGTNAPFPVDLENTLLSFSSKNPEQQTPLTGKSLSRQGALVVDWSVESFTLTPIVLTERDGNSQLTLSPPPPLSKS